MTQIRKIWHRDAYRLGIFFGFDEDLKWRAKQAGALWSRTRQSGFDLALNTATITPDSVTGLGFTQALPGHSRFMTTTIYTHPTPRGTERMISPLDRLAGERNAKNNTTQNTEK